MSKEAMKLALEALENSRSLEPVDVQWVKGKRHAAITALREALAEQPAQQDSTCSNALRIQHKPYPRTCKKCGLGPCVELAQQALDKKAENARELGLDYEPAQQEPVAWRYTDARGHYRYRGFVANFDKKYPMLKPQPLYTPPPAHRTWVGLTPEQAVDLYKATETDNRMVLIDAIEAKLKEKNT